MTIGGGTTHPRCIVDVCKISYFNSFSRDGCLGGFVVTIR